MRIVTTNPWKSLGKGASILLVFILWPALCIAQTNDLTAKVLTLEDAMNYALQHYPAVRASLEQVSAARAGVTLARTQYLPQLSGVYQASRATQNQVNGIWLPTPMTATVIGPIGSSSGQSFWSSQAAAFFSWEPLDFGVRSARVGQARSAEDKSQADLDLTQLQVATAVGNYFLVAVANEQAVVAAQANVDHWQVLNNSIHVLVDNQLRPGVDGSRADAELARAKTQLYQAQQGERVALDTLASLMGTAGSEIQLDGGPLLDLPQTASLLESSVSDHPLSRDQMASVRQVQAEEKIEQRSDYPRLFVQAEGLARGSGVPNNGSIIGNWNGAAPARGNWVTGITILFPDVFAFKARSTEEQISKANERSERAHYDQSIQDLTGQTRSARDQLKGAELIARETPIELAAARQSETQSRTRYQSGLTTIAEVAEAENLLAQAEMDDAIARLNVWRGLFGVAYAQGNLQTFLQVLHRSAPGDH
ncbi:MAG: TolC family protein [Candidatus Acidiferrales bacterium]